MKKILLTTLAVFGLFLASCSNDNEQADGKINYAQIKSVLTTEFETVEDERMAFTLLSNEEKAALWQDKLSSIISEDNLNTDQTALMEELLVKITPEIWDRNNPYHDYFTNIYLPDVIQQASLLFADGPMTVYFFRVGRQTLGFSPGGIGGVSSCNCLQAEVTQWDCGVFNSSTCGISKCKEVDGCGALNTSFCDGRCS